METGASETSAYGAPLAGGDFDFVAFIKQPQTIVRLLSWVFAIVVFACITAEGYANQIHSFELVCVFNGSAAACQYAVGVGVLSFLGCVSFLVLDAYFPHISNAKERKHIVTADLTFSGMWAGLWFVCFCFLANQWSHTTNLAVVPAAVAARAAIAFSFLSVPTWGVLAFLALRRYRQGVVDLGQSQADFAPDQAPPYSSATPEGFHQPPFSPSNAQPQEEPGFQAPVF
ncbi:hypothetical protein AAFF_G00315040 [Aldrovandia affinis]|uniref:Synaptogyrin n=1 Tax=Aldrovandia affinis TaxID=143900 RepID=A0AAD7R809_9TELE|nr:hypothetical protein AAFF_G00315040 [Aldrovandia affinis]